MEIKKIPRQISVKVSHLLIGATFLGSLLGVITSPHYERAAGPGEFRRPEAKVEDLIPGYGFYSYTNRMRGTESFSEWAQVHYNIIKDTDLGDVLSLGTSDWPKDLEHRGTANARAAQSSVLLMYHFLMALEGMDYLFDRKRKKKKA